MGMEGGKKTERSGDASGCFEHPFWTRKMPIFPPVSDNQTSSIPHLCSLKVIGTMKAAGVSPPTPVCLGLWGTARSQGQMAPKSPGTSTVNQEGS